MSQVFVIVSLLQMHCDVFHNERGKKKYLADQQSFWIYFPQLGSKSVQWIINIPPEEKEKSRFPRWDGNSLVSLKAKGNEFDRVASANILSLSLSDVHVHLRPHTTSCFSAEGYRMGAKTHSTPNGVPLFLKRERRRICIKQILAVISEPNAAYWGHFLLV